MSYIPDEIAVISKDMQTVAYRSSHTKGVKGYDPERGVVVLTKSYVADAKNKNTLRSGMEWAYGQAYDDWKEMVETGELPILIRKNTPITGIRLLGLEFRGEGGRAYKVMTDDGYYYDMREDVVLDTIREVGVQPGGVLNGSFVWAIIGSQMKLIRHDSELYYEALDSMKIRNTKALGLKDLVEGGVYKTKSNTYLVYIGRVDTIKVKGGGVTDAVTEAKNSPIFVEIYGNPNYQQGLLETVNTACLYRYAVKRPTNLLEKVGDVQLPPDLIDTIRNLAQQNVQGIIAHRSPRATHNIYSSSYWDTDERLLMTYGPLCYARRVGEPIPSYAPFDRFLQKTAA